LAVSGDSGSWAIVNASPDLRSQIIATNALHPQGATSRASPIAAVVLTGAEIDQFAGLLCLRERQSLSLYGTAATFSYLARNAMLDVLSPEIVVRHAIALEESFPIAGTVQARLFAVPGKAPLYAEGDDPTIGMANAVNTGVEMARGGARMMFVPGCAAITPALKDRLARADIVLFDGTLFTDDEMIRTRTGSKTGRRMGHIPIAGADGSLARLADFNMRRIYIHINNTNPILIRGSDERRQVEAAGWEVAEDGLEIAL
jgi:pyrroloquinoline quinone biosynthesis protein B